VRLTAVRLTAAGRTTWHGVTARIRARVALVALAVAVGAVPSGTLPARLLDVAASASAPACPSNLADQLDSTEGAAQLITVEAGDYRATTATLSAWQRVGRCFVRTAGPWSAMIGASGLSDHHVEGDGTTPTGAYRIGPTMYGVAPDPGVAFAYHRLECGDWWDEDPTSPRYNTFQHVRCGAVPPFAGDSEALWTEVPSYEHLAVIEYNTDPVVAGRGSGIFLHVSTGTPTAGCVALPEPELDVVLRWLRPGEDPLVVIGAANKIRRY
jgi:L,D-peptidoglycan transpeptidase YkuD (ErfK/YbiS/YcfS/YnhG family)